MNGPGTVKGPLKGRVEGIASAIADRERSSGLDLPGQRQPDLRLGPLAQRVPVRIAIDDITPGLQLICDRTATVMVERRIR